MRVFEEAREDLPAILEARRDSGALLPLATLDLLTVGANRRSRDVSKLRAFARERIDRRDEDDWPVLAAALALGCPIWTEDTDFFGCGVATWTTDRVELYLAMAAEREP